jgi:hypothetical protein
MKHLMKQIHKINLKTNLFLLVLRTFFIYKVKNTKNISQKVDNFKVLLISETLTKLPKQLNFNNQ